MKKINIEDLLVNNEYYIIYKELNVIIPLGKLEYKVELKHVLDFHWHEGPTYGNIYAYKLFFPDAKDIKLKTRLAHITLEEINKLFEEYDGFYLLEK